jgi:hypothetical protein
MGERFVNMLIKRRLRVGASAVAALVVSLVFVISAAAEVPNVTSRNVGGPPTAGTNTCTYTLRNEICRITITNGSTFEVRVVEEEITPPNAAARYTLVESTCERDRDIPSRGTCSAQIRLLIDKPACVPKWSQGYAVRVQERGNPGNTIQVNQILEVV